MQCLSDTNSNVQNSFYSVFYIFEGSLFCLARLHLFDKIFVSFKITFLFEYIVKTDTFKDCLLHHEKNRFGASNHLQCMSCSHFRCNVNRSLVHF